ncbi:MAG: PBP1A family penicillin-binding protein [Nitrospirae bacterium]|nr:PBP1A family penicillin-binding protein [Nitrospirota bacterium]
MSKIRNDVKRAENKDGLLKSLKYIIPVIFIGMTIGISSGFVLWTLSDLPKIKSLEESPPLESSLIFASEGDLIAELYLERRTFVPYYKIPARVKNAFIAVEDARFYQHHGIDVIRIFSALVKDVFEASFVQGGSTITQQLTKLLFLKPERSISRKIKEAALSLQIEKHYTKDEIIGLYLNQAYFGTRAYGIEAAAQTYFGKTTQEITVPEAALLAALLKAPTNYSPFINPEKSLVRRNFVLSRMVDAGFITKDQYNVFSKEPLPVTSKKRAFKSPYFVEYARKKLEQKYGNQLYTDAFKIHTTLDLRLQQIAETAIENGIAQLEKRRKPGIQAALLAIDVKTGAIRAMVGGTDFWTTQFNRSVLAYRQPGSVFKPFVYLTALKQGHTPDDMIEDSPISFPDGNGGTWSPQNYEEIFNGPVTLKVAMAKSLNAATVRLADQIGIKNIIETTQEIGIKENIQPYLSSALGATDMTLIDIVYAYAVLATGNKLTPFYIDKVVSRDGITDEEPIAPPQKVIDDNVIINIRTMLRAVILQGTGSAAKIIERPVYGKTGTTNDFTDAWFVGFDDDIVVGVWVGRDNHKPIGNKETGAMAALPIWIEFMQKK